MGNGKIFIQIASYRDPQLIPTIKDCIKNAKKPEKLVFSIAWQHSSEDVWDNLDEFKDDKRFRIVDINYSESKGACWARNQLQQNYNGEEYTLQLDSHHRFVENWDEELILMYKQLVKKGHKKPLLTGYVSSFDPDNDPNGRTIQP
jgi:glycosyltransferase involved in cell wall biosynthesis